MIMLITYLIAQVTSAVTCSGTTATISDEASITKSMLSQCSGADTLVATSSNAVTFPLDAFMGVTTLKSITVTAPTVTFGQQCFQQANNIQTIKVQATQTVSFNIDSFNNAHVARVECYAGNSITLGQQAFQQVSEITLLNLTSGGTISLAIDSFMSSTVNEVILSAVQDVNVEQQAMQQVKNFNKITVQTKGNFAAKIDSFISSMIHEVYVKCDGTANFEQQCFQNTPNLTSLIVDAKGGIAFKIDSFINSHVGKIELYTQGKVEFGQQAFQSCHQLTNLSIHGASDVTFGLDAFIDSQIQAMNITSTNQNGNAIILANAGTVTFNQGSFKSCDRLKTVDINTNGNVDIKSNSFQDSSALQTLNIHADGKATVESNAFQGCSSLKTHNIDAHDTDIAGDAFSGSGKKHGSSSHKDDDSDSEMSAKTLGDFKIESVYLGTSPNIFVNLNFLVAFMKKARKTFGHIIPSPELIHSAIWVGKENPTDESVGAIFVYGKYWNKHNLPSYINKDGAKAYVMTLGEFKERYPAINPMKLNPHKNVKLFDFINKAQNSGKWTAKDYNWPTNNCQHFTAKLIGILKATRDQPNNEDWVHLPKPVINSLKLNEDFLEKKN